MSTSRGGPPERHRTIDTRVVESLGGREFVEAVEPVVPAEEEERLVSTVDQVIDSVAYHGRARFLRGVGRRALGRPAGR
jgi:hypothetical protein